MKKGTSSYRENGERIHYKVQTKIDESKSQLCAGYKKLSSSYTSTQGQDFKENYSSAEQVLDVLNYHIDSLDNLQKLNSLTKIDHSFHDVNENLSLDDTFQLNTTFNKTSANDKCAQNRKHALDQYLRENIKGREECACHFQHYDHITSCRSEPVKWSLAAGSANYHSRESSLNERVTEENFRANVLSGSTNSLISSLTEASNPDEAIYIEREDVCLLDDRKSARCFEGQSRGLFIEGALKSQKGEPVTAPVTETTTTSYYDCEQVAKLRKHKAQHCGTLFYDNKLPTVLKQTEVQCKCCCADFCFQILTNSINSFPLHQSQTLRDRPDDTQSASERVLTESSRFSSVLNTIGDRDEDLLEISSSNDDESIISEPGNTLEGLSDSLTYNSDRVSPERTSSAYTSDILSEEASLYYKDEIDRKKFCSRISCLLTQPSIETISLPPHNLKSSSLTKNHSSLSLTKNRNLSSSVATSDASDQSSLRRKRSSFSCGRSESFQSSDGTEIDEKANSLPLNEINNRVWASSSVVKEGYERESKDNYTSGKRFPVLQVRRNLHSLSSNNCDECRFVREAFSSAQKLKDNVEASSSGEESKNVSKFNRVEDYEKSMRTARDIARLSIPSLSALQYLPNQIDSSNKFLISKSNNNNKTKSDTKMNSNTKSESKTNTLQGFYAESKDIHSDQSSLLRRLCSCNCLAKSQQNMTEQEKNPQTVNHEVKRKKSYLAKNLHSAGNSSIKDYTETKKKRTRSHASESSSLADTERLSAPSGIECESSKRFSDGRSSRVEVQSKADEKQYPRFLDIVDASHNLDEEKEASLTMRGKMPVVERDFQGKRRRDIRSSECDRVSTPLSSSRDGSDLDTTNESAYSFLRTRSSSFASDSRVADSLDSKENLRPHSVCSTLKEESRKRFSPFKRFLSPSKLFTSANKTRSEEFDEVQKEKSTKRSWKKDCHLSKNRSSFLRRSINRLSERKGSPVSNTNSNSRIEDNLEESASIPARYISASPSISVSFCDSLTGSENSLDNELPHLLGTKSNLSQAAEINFNLAGPTSDLGASDDTKSNISMRRSCEAENFALRNNSRSDVNLVTGDHSLRGSCDLKSDFRPFNTGCSYSLPSSPLGSKLNVDRHSDIDEYQSLCLSHSPKPFHSPITQSSRIEDGLKVCSTEHFEKHIGNIKSIEIEAQKRLFQAWINHFSPNLIQHDLFDELRDGIKLIGLLASLTHDKQLHHQYQSLRLDKQSVVHRLVITPTSRLKHLSNVSVAVDYLRQKLGMKLINLNPMDIVSGKANVILGLCWNIILKFQLEQTNVHYLDSFNEATQSEDSRQYTSRLSSSSTNEDRVSKSTKERKIRKLQNEFEEYSSKDLVNARKRLLHHVNKRFNLKLTNLTSNLMDGDVMLLILKNLIAAQTHIPVDQVFGGDIRDWSSLSNDEKLDNCFSIADIHLGVPRLFKAIDLKKQTISDNNSKPLLVYLSMLLNTNSKGEPLELLQENLSTSFKSKTNNFNLEAQLILDAIDCEDKFELDKLQSTLIELNELEKLIDATSGEEDSEKISAHLVTRCKSLRASANEIEALIIWINEADNLFEKTCSTAAELSKTIVEYGNFFSPSNVPEVTTPLCSTLERQYRECLSFAKQRVLLMEQTLKNWEGYENSKGQLKDWLSIAESKLSQALSFNQEDATSLEQQTRCLEELIDYFELEECDMNIEPATGCSDNQFSINEGDSMSISGSVLSLISTSSRTSNLQSSKKAKYVELFNEFELKCRLLSTMLDSDQKDALLLGVRELRQRLRYITEQKVPQVVNNLRLNIEQNKLLEKEVELVKEEAVTESCDIPQCLVMTEETSSLGTQHLITDHVSSVLDSNNSSSRGSPPVPLDKISVKSKRVKRLTDFELQISEDHDIKSRNKIENDEQEELLNYTSSQTSSFLRWLFPESERPTSFILDGRTKKLSKNLKSPITKNSNKRSTKKSARVTNQESGSDEFSYVRLLWQKVVRAYRASVSLNIVLLICLAGICVVPLIQQNACCELVQNHVSTDTFAMNEKPT